MSNRNVLVVGGAGYVGSHTCKALAAAGYNPVTYDNLSAGHRWAVQWGPLVEADLQDTVRLRAALQHYRITAVLHFAAHAYVAESMHAPQKYFHNNVINSSYLLDSILAENVSKIIFSSSCATYGLPMEIPMRESHPQSPINPYGESKLAVEKMLKWYAEPYGLKYVALRYFNAAGADPEGCIGESHDPEPHLIPLVLEAAAGKRGAIRIFGNDYPTPDGTAVRDYIHVTDLANAHVKALQHLEAGGASLNLNVGTGRGHSVQEVIRMAEQVIGKAIPAVVEDRRAGDPAMLIADASEASRVLGWVPTHSSLQFIIETAWNWYAVWEAVHRPKPVIQANTVGAK